mmetsp:Transcript_33956/g.68409  ORF Transcript_33956/g.68409 Transcript_33956/m.68409 type:complete len:83 (-) Transcript_33956:1799-2047(-)
MCSCCSCEISREVAFIREPSRFNSLDEGVRRRYNIINARATPTAANTAATHRCYKLLPIFPPTTLVYQAAANDGYYQDAYAN